MFSRLLTLLLVGFIATSIAGFALDRPVLMSYATSGSMRPTLDVGDLFFINPLSKGGVGQIIVFKLNGHWTVHRVYAEVSGGYITKGDNNVATDQKATNPVRMSDVAGTVVTVNGEPVKIPKVGVYIEKIAKYTGKIHNLYVAFALLAAGSLLITAKEKKRKKGKKIVVRYRTLYTIISALTVAVLLIAITSTWSLISFDYASTVAGGQREGWYLPGSSFEENFTVKKTPIPSICVLNAESSRVVLNDTAFVLWNKNKIIKAKVKVPLDTRLYVENINIYRYPYTLPEKVIVEMAKYDPRLPLLAFSAEFASILSLVYLATGSGDEVVFKFRRRFV